MSANGKSKTIKPPGSLTARVSVACDRCRKKKIRCFYDDNDNDPNKQCANCNSVGLQCIFSDKLARKAFPRGYTESLEERVRELEYENKKLQKLMSMKSTSDNNTIKSDTGETKRNEPIVKSESMSPQNPVSLSPNPMTMSSHLNSANLSVLNTQFPSSDFHTHDEHCNCEIDHTLINRPVSIAGSVDIDNGNLSDDNASLLSASSFQKRRQSRDLHHHLHPHSNQLNPSRYSFEQVNAPGAAAAISLQKKLRTKNFMNLANLIATSIPRSTDETLFIPTLLAKIVRVHGFESKAPFLTARSIALLKEAYNEKDRYNIFPITFKGINFNELKKNESVQFFQSLNLPNHSNLDVCINIFFETWNTTIPILNKEIFMENYQKFDKSRESGFTDGEMFGFEKFGELLVIITCLVMVSNERNNFKSNPNEESNNQGNSDVLQFYDHLIKQFIQSNLSSICCISSLQIKTIELLYCLTTGDLNTSYDVRGKMITMCQQMRLHRCPAAVLGSNGSKVSKLQQGERRILFWCIYTLESFSAFILGVPRLLKDYEIECALPSLSTNDENKESEINLITFNNNGGQLTLVGKVCESALEIMRFAKVLGTIVDTTFKRNNGTKETNVSESTCLLLEEMLNNWLVQLPYSISFELIERGPTNSNIENYTNTQLTLMFLYYQAKALIYMTMLNNAASSKNSPAFISTPQASTNLLTVSKVLASASHNYYFLPLPMNAARQKARFCLLSARNSLEYTRGGSLFQEAKNLLSYTINELRIETKIGLLGCLSENCFNCLELAIDSILSQPKSGLVDGNGPVDSIKKESKKKVNGSPLKVVSIDGGETKTQPAINDIFSSPEEDQPNDNNLDINSIQKQKIAELASKAGGVSSHSDLFAFMKLDPKTSEQDKLNSLLNGDHPKQKTPDHLSQMNSLTDLMMMNDFGVDASLGLSLIDFELDSSLPKKTKLNSNKANSVSSLGNGDGGGTGSVNGYKHGHEYQHRSNYARSNGSVNFDFATPDAVMEDIGTFKADLEDLNNDLFPSTTRKHPPSSNSDGTPRSLFGWTLK